eukprot:5276174-Pleurochrysis_carterae.AAC.2
MHMHTHLLTHTHTHADTHACAREALGIRSQSLERTQDRTRTGWGVRRPVSLSGLRDRRREAWVCTATPGRCRAPSFQKRGVGAAGL